MSAVLTPKTPKVRSIKRRIPNTASTQLVDPTEFQPPPLTTKGEGVPMTGRFDPWFKEQVEVLCRSGKTPIRTYGEFLRLAGARLMEDMAPLMGGRFEDNIIEGARAGDRRKSVVTLCDVRKWIKGIEGDVRQLEKDKFHVEAEDMLEDEWQTAKKRTDSVGPKRVEALEGSAVLQGVMLRLRLKGRL